MASLAWACPAGCRVPCSLGLKPTLGPALTWGSSYCRAWKSGCLGLWRALALSVLWKALQCLLKSQLGVGCVLPAFCGRMVQAQVWPCSSGASAAAWGLEAAGNRSAVSLSCPAWEEVPCGSSWQCEKYSGELVFRVPKWLLWRAELLVIRAMDYSLGKKKIKEETEAEIWSGRD